MSGQLAKLGRYELITQIGQGGMAEVQLALQRGPAGFEKLVVVKLVHESLASEKTFVDMLLDEARVAALVKHPNVVDIYDLGEADGRYFIAMEYLEGEPLLGLLRAGRDGNRLDPLSMARLVADTAGGLDAAHELRSLAGERIELVHHDVSLGNIVVLYNGQVKLVDFGVAKATQRVGSQMKVHGKFGYMAPEKLRGLGGDRRGDIWSLGVVLWEALTLRRLFRGNTDTETMRLALTLDIPPPSTINPYSPPDLDPIAMRALERDPTRRYATAKELARDLEEVLRQHGYGGRNDVIADYMQATFASHIAARKRLLQEVTTKGRASAAVLEAAFEDDQAPRGAGEFSIQFRRHGSHDGIRRKPVSRDEEIGDIIDRRRVSDSLLAEGTPSASGLPRRPSKPSFAEATPILPEEAIASEERDGRAERAGRAPEARHARASTPEIAAIVDVPPRRDTPPSAELDLERGDIELRPPDRGPREAAGVDLDLDVVLDSDARQQIESSRKATMGRVITDMLERIDVPIDEDAAPQRPSSRRLVPIPVNATPNMPKPVANATFIETRAPPVSPKLWIALGLAVVIAVLWLVIR